MVCIQELVAVLELFDEGFALGKLVYMEIHPTSHCSIIYNNMCKRTNPKTVHITNTDRIAGIFQGGGGGWWRVGQG